jgi:hypothetical protein
MSAVIAILMLGDAVARAGGGGTSRPPRPRCESVYRGERCERTTRHGVLRRHWGPTLKWFDTEADNYVAEGT